MNKFDERRAKWWARLSPIEKWLALAWGKPAEVAPVNRVEAWKRLRAAGKR